MAVGTPSAGPGPQWDLTCHYPNYPFSKANIVSVLHLWTLHLVIGVLWLLLSERTPKASASALVENPEGG